MSKCLNFTFGINALVFDRLNALKPFKSPGPDGFHSYILKAYANSLTKSLFILFRQSLNMGNIPKEWKCANITAILKRAAKQSQLITKSGFTVFYGCLDYTRKLRICKTHCFKAVNLYQFNQLSTGYCHRQSINAILSTD